MELLAQILNTHLICVFMVYGHFWDAWQSRHTKIGHGHLLNVWKAPEGPDTLEMSHDSGFRTESPENPVEVG